MATSNGLVGFLGGVARMLTGAPRTSPRSSSARSVMTDAPDAAVPAGSPGRAGAAATVEIDPSRVGAVHLSYTPVTDGDPDPGEIVWTWVPYEEDDGRGKDRPVVIVATEPGGTVLAAQLTSKDHGGERDFVALGIGDWDPAGRPSWVNIDRIFRVSPGGMRREAAALDARRYELVEAALRRRYRWS